MWKALELWTRKVVGCSKQSLKDCHSRNLLNRSAGSNVDCGNPDQEVLEWNNIINWAKGCSYDVLAKNMTAFQLCPKNLLELSEKVID